MMFFIFSMLFSIQVKAISVDQFCSQFPFSEEKIRCYKTVQSKYVEEKTLDLCMRFSFESERFECLNSILDRSFTDKDIEICHAAVFDSDRSECIKNRGKAYVKPTIEILNLAKAARNHLKSKELTKADDNLSKIINLAK